MTVRPAQTATFTGPTSSFHGTHNPPGPHPPHRPPYDTTRQQHAPEALGAGIPPSQHPQNDGQGPPVYREQHQPPQAGQRLLPDPSDPASEAHPPLTEAFRAPVNGMPHANTALAAPVSHPAYPSPAQVLPPLSQEAHRNGDALPPLDSIPAPSYLSRTPAPYSVVYYNSPAFETRQKRKAARAQQACDQCRLRKAKCDEGRPACSHCKENNLICVYKESPPTIQEKATQTLLDRMQQLEDGLGEKFSQLQHMQVDNSLQIRQLACSVGTIKESVAPKGKGAQGHPAGVSHDAKLPSSANDTILNDNQALIIGEDGPLSISAEHITVAHKLLLWPKIKKLLDPNEYDEDYVMRLEEKRGLIRVYGRGEGDETSENSPPSTNPSAAVEEVHADHHSPSGPWGGANQRQSKLADIGLDDAGRVTTTPRMILRYYKSYMEHLHKLHPFLDQNDLKRKVKVFIPTYCPGAGGQKPQRAKRKRSCNAYQGAGSDMRGLGTAKDEAGSRIIERSLDNAIVLLVLGLGYICTVRDRPVPGPVMDHVVDFRKEQIPGSSTLSVLPLTTPGSAMSLQSNSLAPNSPSSKFPYTGGGRNSTAGPLYLDDPNLQNRDVIPGFAFYAYATGILGHFLGANSLEYAQAALLAGLYAGQVAHPFQSHGWIFQASRASQILVREKSYQKMRDGPRKDLYDFVYWACFQLESDIVAELDLPASGISWSEARIALPKGRFTLSLPNEISAPSTMMMFFYSAQIYLHKILNCVHKALYKARKQGQTCWSSNVQEILSASLEEWRKNLPDILRWKDGDPPSKDINAARLRAKYYGARCIIHRPLLYLALHYATRPKGSANARPLAASTIPLDSESQQVSPSMTHGQSATDMAQLSSDTGPAPNPPSNPAPGQGPCTYRELPKKLRRACKVCIKSAIMSTEAFDGIEGRPIVTNIFGTAHAYVNQFENMLVLSATYTSNLSELVNGKDLERLFRRTINFLLQSRYISPSLRADARILTEIYERIFEQPAGSVASR